MLVVFKMDPRVVARGIEEIGMRRTAFVLSIGRVNEEKHRRATCPQANRCCSRRQYIVLRHKTSKSACPRQVALNDVCPAKDSVVRHLYEHELTAFPLQLHTLILSASSSALVTEPSEAQKARVRRFEAAEKAQRRHMKDKRSSIKRSRSGRDD